MNLRFLHLRKADELNRPVTRGGTTIAYMIDEHDQVHKWAAARCSTQENYCKAKGRLISAGRLQSKMYVRKCGPVAEKAFIASVKHVLGL